jgi:hypothetical protein
MCWCAGPPHLFFSNGKFYEGLDHNRDPTPVNHTLFRSNCTCAGVGVLGCPFCVHAATLARAHANIDVLYIHVCVRACMCVLSVCVCVAGGGL